MIGRKVIAAGVAISSLFTFDLIQETNDDLSTFGNHFQQFYLSTDAPVITKVVVYDAVSDTIPWLKDFYDTAGNADNAKQVLPLISGVKSLFREKKYSVVNEILLEMDVNRLSHTAMVAFISATYPARHKLDSWSLSVNKVRLALSRDGLNTEHILQGLI